MEKGLGIYIRKEHVPGVQKYVRLIEPRIREYFPGWAKQIGFTSDLSAPWGFNDAIRPTASKNPDELVWHVLWPRMKQRKNGWHNQDQAIYLSASLWALCNALQDVMYTLHGAELPRTVLFSPQLAVPEPRMHGAALWCTFAPRVRTWMKQRGERLLPEVQDAMYRAHRIMCGQKWLRAEIGDFGAHMRNGYQLHLHVPGNCACMGSDPMRNHEDEEIDVQSHNVDGPIQQLALFAGLVRFSELITTDVTE